MMPINWLMSFLFFLIVFLMFNILNYYIYNIKPNNNNNISYKNNFKLKNLYWKW
uniref:ATP synthase F0 subunit 8 n=1 Tax=Risoba obstructa TaxID=1126736 RepID=A0A8K1X773_9NEOP|nr:ATP synthase F0 subunit 8 [Risoba obstructa]